MLMVCLSDCLYRVLCLKFTIVISDRQCVYKLLILIYVVVLNHHLFIVMYLELTKLLEVLIRARRTINTDKIV